MPFLEHLEELRWRIVKSLIAGIIAFAFSFWVVTNYDVITILAKPIEPFLHGKKLYVTGPFEKFTILMQLAVTMAIALASPIIGYQVWGFLAPALMPKERRIIVPVLAGAVVLFFCGVALNVLVFIPTTMKLLDGINTPMLESLFTASEYFGMLLMLSLAFGALFELPILILILTALGLITPKLLTTYRRHAFVAILILCEIATPGDLIISTLIMFVPVYGLYELSLIVSWIVWRARRKRLDAAGNIGIEAAA
jgi:sec-independent protein translocase protein TatC